MGEDNNESFEIEPALSPFRLPDYSVSDKRIVGVPMAEELKAPVVVGKKLDFRIRDHFYTIRPLLAEEAFSDIDVDSGEPFSLTESIGLPKCTYRIYFRVFASICNLFRDKKMRGDSDPGCFTLSELVRYVKLYKTIDEKDYGRIRDVDLRRFINRIAWSLSFSVCRCIVYGKSGAPITHVSPVIGLSSTEREDVDGTREVTYHFLGSNIGMMDPDQLLWVTDKINDAARVITFDGTIDKKVRTLTWFQYVAEQIAIASSYGYIIEKDRLPKEILEKSDGRPITSFTIRYNDLYAFNNSNTKMQKKRLRDDLYDSLKAMSDTVVGWENITGGKNLSLITIFVYSV